jgi:hypothetical protein
MVNALKRHLKNACASDVCLFLLRILTYENWRAHYFRPKKLNSVALVRERTTPTEQPPFVGEVSANFYE